MINNRKVYRTNEEKGEIIKDWQNSGLSAKAFSASLPNPMHHSLLYVWRAKLAKNRKNTSIQKLEPAEVIKDVEIVNHSKSIKPKLELNYCPHCRTCIKAISVALNLENE